jgi:glycosyltransferase involved in cell wall biosynthesis
MNRTLTETPTPLGRPNTSPKLVSGSQSQRWRVAILVTNPIQYFAPLFAQLAQQPEFDLTVLYCSLQGAQAERDPGFGISIAWDRPVLEGYRYKLVRNYWRWGSGRFFSYVNPGIIHELRAGAYDAVIVFGWGHLSAWLAFAGARLSGTPWILYGDSVSIFDEENGWLKRKLKRAILRPLFRKTSAFLVMGRFNQGFYDSYGVPRGKCFRMPYPVDNDFFSRAAEKARGRRTEVRARYGIPAHAIVVLFVGKLIPLKHAQDLLDTLKHLQPSIPDLGAVFVGEGQLRADLEAYSARHSLKNVFILGFKNQTEVPEIYAMSDIFLMPSSHDKWGLVINEAMACGLSVVVSDRAGAWADLVKNGENGFVYRCGQLAALERAIRAIALDPALRERMGKKSLDIIDTYGYDQCVEGITKALESLEDRN